MTAEFTDPASGTRPWLAHYPVGIPHSIEGIDQTLLDLFDKSTRSFADRPALESFGVRLTYSELKLHADAVAAYLQDKGLRKGDRVAIMLPNIAAYMPILFGILKAGGVVVNTNPLYTVRELAYQMQDAGARILFYLSLFEKTVSDAREEVAFDHLVRVDVGDLIGLKGRLISLAAGRKARRSRASRIKDAATFRHAISEGRRLKLKTERVAPDDLAFLQYTGGTTGVSKGATLRHRNVIANVEQCTAWFGPSLNLETERHVTVTALPLYHIFGLTACALFTLRIGGCALLIANPRDLDGFVRTLRKQPFTLMAGVNTLYNALADHPKIRKVNFSRLALCTGGGMAIKSSVAEKWKRLTGRPIVEGYGLSETSPGVTFNRPDIDVFTGTIGYPLPSTEVEIRDGEGRSLAAGEAGELCVRGPQVMCGYWNRPDASGAVFTADGFFRTGDIAMMLPDGQVKLVDRLKEMINVSGFNVYPNEVEEVIARIPQVSDVAVVGWPDEHSGEAVAAYVVRRDKLLGAEQVREHCKKALTGYKVPKHVVFRDELPKSNIGKVLRRALREEALRQQ